MRDFGFACMECGHRFRSIKAAERAAFGDDGCPGCGGSDIDMDPGPELDDVDPRPAEVHPSERPGPKTAEDQGFTIGGFYNTK